MISRILFLISFIILIFSISIATASDNVTKDQKIIYGDKIKLTGTDIEAQTLTFEDVEVVSEPDDGYKVREIVIGENGRIFVTLTIKNSEPQFQYNYTNSAFIKVYDIKTGEQKNEVLVDYTNVSITPMGAEGIGRGNNIFNFDLGKFLYDNLLDYAFPSLEYSSAFLSIQENGLVLKNKGYNSIILLSNEALKKRLSVNNFNNVKILPTFETTAVLFIQFQIEIENNFGDDFYQITIPIEKSEIQKN